MVEDWAKQKAEEGTPQQAPPEAPGPSPVVEKSVPEPPTPATEDSAPVPSPGSQVDDQKSVVDRLFKNRNKAKDRATAHLERKHQDSGLGGAWDADVEEEPTPPNPSKPAEQNIKPPPPPAGKPLSAAELRAQEEERERARREADERHRAEREAHRKRGEELTKRRADEDRRTPGLYRVHSGHAEKAVLKGMWAKELKSLHFRMFNVEEDMGINVAEKIYDYPAHTITEMHGLARSMEFVTHILPVEAPPVSVNFDGTKKVDLPTPEQIRSKQVEEEKSRQQEQIQQMTQEEEVVL
uniref:Uncharacterized protein n=1 Tax=Hemiselmis andersenii TaxID=464988 RepID=A0A6U4MY03_HEMAN